VCTNCTGDVKHHFSVSRDFFAAHCRTSAQGKTLRISKKISDVEVLSLEKPGRCIFLCVARARRGKRMREMEATEWNNPQSLDRYPDTIHPRKNELVQKTQPESPRNRASITGPYSLSDPGESELKKYSNGSVFAQGIRYHSCSQGCSSAIGVSPPYSRMIVSFKTSECFLLL